MYLLDGNALAAVKLVEARLDLVPSVSQMPLPQAVLFFQQPKGFADDFAGRLIKAAVHFAGDQPFQFGTQ